MNHQRLPRSDKLIDAIDAKPRTQFSGIVWRATAEYRDPLKPSRSGGRWDDGTFDVIYASEKEGGAEAEIYYHLSQGQPVFPSKKNYVVHQIEVVLNSVLSIPTLQELGELGVNTSTYGRLSYQRRVDEYVATQELGEAAHFLEFDGLLVPNARFSCQNLVIFADRLGPHQLNSIAVGPAIDWSKWDS